MLTIRLQRTGRKNNPTFRVIVIDSKRGPKSGNVLEVLGSYEPKQGKRELKGERILHWISQGAQTSGTIHNMLVDAKIVDAKKINVLPKKKPILKDAPKVEEAPAPAEAPAPEEAPAETPVETAPEAPSETVEAPAEEPAPAPAE